MATSKNTEDFYPDIVDAGGLNNALREAFTTINSELGKKELAETSHSQLCVLINHGNRFSQIFVAEEERLFLFDFWRDGVMFANGRTSDITAVATAVNEWVAEECTIDELQAISYVTLTDNAKAYDEGNEVESRWTSYLLSIPKDIPELANFLNVAATAPQLRKLFPYTSLNSFCFSRCTGYPFTSDTPYVQLNSEHLYSIYSCKGKLIGRGNASVAVQLVIDHLPPNCGPAVRGTAGFTRESEA